MLSCFFFFYETMEAEVGQNITLPCFVKDAADYKIISIKWMKNEGTSLLVYNRDYPACYYAFGLFSLSSLKFDVTVLHSFRIVVLQDIS